MEITNIRQEKIKYTMCSNQSCCPVLEQVDDNKFTISDDYEGEVVLTKAELKLLKKFLNENKAFGE
jgi:hypothetical protein